jgi:hypothetical protein
MATDTDVIAFPWQFLPPHTTRVLTPRARLRRFRNRVLASSFANDVRAAYRATFWWRVIAAGLLLGFYVVATRHVFLDWSGFHPISGGIR